MVSMSTPTLGTTASRDPNRVLPKGESIGRYTSYLDAQKAVDYLADNKFAVQQVAIIGNDLKSVERVTGRLTYPRVALASAASGAWFGLFVGIILGLFGGTDMLSTVPSSIALGAIFWLLFGVITYALQRGKRDFTSISQVVATSYDVIVEPAVAGEARRLLQKLPMNGQAQHPGSSAGAWEQAPQQPTSGTPDRPASWNDPYAGQQGPARPQQPGSAGEAAPEGGTAGADEDARTAGPGSTGPRRGQFPDLPDGRPQYGVRVQEQRVADRAGGTGDTPAPEGPASDGGHGSSAMNEQR